MPDATLHPTYALLYHQGMPVAVYPARDLDRHRLRLHGSPKAYEPDTTLEAEVDLPGHGRFRLPVRVARSRPGLLELRLERIPDDLDAILPGE